MSILICYDRSPSDRRAVEVAAHTLGGAPAVPPHVRNPSERIICATHDHTSMEAGLLGSVANAPAHVARRRVLIVPSAPQSPE